MDVSWRVRGLARALQRRVRLRTRLRRARETLRGARPRRLPAWSAAAPSAPAVTLDREQAEVTVSAPGGLRRPLDGEARAVRVVVADWRAPVPGWSGRLGPLPGLTHHEVDLPAGGRGRACVSVTLAEPLPLSRVAAAVLPVLEPLRGPMLGDGGSAVVQADARAASPRGRQRYGSSMPVGELQVDGEQWRVRRVSDGETVVGGRVDEALDERQRAVLAELGCVTLPPHPRRSRSYPAQNARSEGAQLLDRRVEAGVVAQLAMTGVVLHGAAPEAEPHLAAPLVAIMSEPLPGDDPMRWEVRSVRQRRTAIRHHGAGFTPPPVSALLVSKRPELATTQVAVLASQTYPELEIVVGLHGGEEPPGLREAAAGRPVQVVTVDTGRNLGQALQAATEAASGELVTKVDDDDRYGAEHVWDLVLAHHYSSATVAGKGAELVYVASKDVTVRRRMGAEFFTDTVAGGTIALARADLDAAGGWPAVPRHVDRALLDRMLDGGGLVYRSHPFGFVYTRHGDGHTWQADADYFLHDVQRRWPGLPTFEELGAA